ncbi:MAG: hypothetical protein AABO58_25405 [Acidobacteriota bacterium]
MDDVWVFNGTTNRFPSAVFASKESAEDWIRANTLTGTLLITRYPVGKAVYDWAVATGQFTPKGEKHRSAEFIANFSSGAQDHFHFENGE